MPEHREQIRKDSKWAVPFEVLPLGDDGWLWLIRLSAAIGLVFLLLYVVVDPQALNEPEHFKLHSISVAGVAAFLALTWTSIFRRFWQFWTFTICLFIMAMFIVFSAVTGDPVSRMIAIILCPFATASFVNWSARWQLAMSFAALGSFAVAQWMVPIPDGFNIYRWLGVLAAVLLAESTAIFVEQYRNRIRGQLEALEAAARFREREIATMAHDIRNPLSALAGYVELLEEPGARPADRDQMIARIGSTAWNTNLVVNNALDLYRMEENGSFPMRDGDIDPNPIIANVADDCAAQARRVGLGWRSELADLPGVRIDPRMLSRIIQNSAAAAIGAAKTGHVRITTSVRDGRIAIEIEAPSASIAAADLEQMMANPRGRSHSPGAGKIGLFLARAMTEAADGAFTVDLANPAGLRLRAEIPCGEIAPARSFQNRRSA